MPRAGHPHQPHPTHTASSHAHPTSNRYAERGLPCSYSLFAEVFVIDPTLFGNVARFMNASCDPCLRPTPMRAARGGGAPGLANAPRVVFVATRNIAAGEELTWRYNAAAPVDAKKAVRSVYGGRRSDGAAPRQGEAPQQDRGHPCLCGAPNCKKWLA